MKFRSTICILAFAVAMIGLVPIASAQITITGPSNGFCSSNPAVQFQSGNAPAPPPNAFKYVPYGAGQLATSTCQFETGEARNAILVNDPPGTSLLTFPNGIDIVGDGTLKGLLVKIGSGTGQDVDVTVWVLHNTTVTQATAFICHIAGGTANASTPLRCEDSTNSVPVFDNDRVFLVFTGNPGDTYGSIRWYLGKQ